MIIPPDAEFVKFAADLQVFLSRRFIFFHRKLRIGLVIFVKMW